MAIAATGLIGAVQEFITPIQLAYLEGNNDMVQLLWEHSPEALSAASSPQPEWHDGTCCAAVTSCSTDSVMQAGAHNKTWCHELCRELNLGLPMLTIGSGAVQSCLPITGSSFASVWTS